VDASAPDSAIELRVTRVHRDGRAMVELSVRDFGTGIPASRLNSIWEPYVTHKPGGTGLGLAIVRQTLLAHDGAVEAVSTAGEGTTMRFFLPADTPTANAGALDV
jgi:two-component system sensor histidine kinase HydH